MLKRRLKIKEKPHLEKNKTKTIIGKRRNHE